MTSDGSGDRPIGEVEGCLYYGIGWAFGLLGLALAFTMVGSMLTNGVNLKDWFILVVGGVMLVVGIYLVRYAGHATVSD